MGTKRETPRNNPLHDRTTTRVVAMTVNPNLLHVYWEISQEDLEKIRLTLHKSPANARPVLRFYDATYILFDGTNAHQSFDVEVDLRTMNWNVPIWSAEKSYVIDLGVKASEGRFYPVARSNVVELPRAEPSWRVDERYLRVERGRIKSLMPIPAVPMPARETVQSQRVQTMVGMRKDTWTAFKGMVKPAQADDPAWTKQRAKEANKTPTAVPKRVPREVEGPARDVSYPFDLVHLTQEKFSLGVSSKPPAQGTNS
ncbi:MAG: DUF4912 domain-containing protein [Deltaproteobacteria bacterium]|jgi:hypothetical protein